MRVTPLAVNPAAYSSNAYLVRGDRNDLGDVNTLVDTGIDEGVVAAIRAVYTGAGKRPVEKVILTHGHFDHVGGVEAIRREFGAVFYGSGANPHADRALADGEGTRIGDREFTAIHCAEHSHDSILLYSRADGVLFSGDTPIDIKMPGGAYQRRFLEVLERLALLDLRTIFPGHGPPVDGANAVIARTLEVVRKSPLV
jgi:glyoxylase-like metal-dependent hydrolase (beta-lactamase superfamily II)